MGQAHHGQSLAISLHKKVVYLSRGYASLVKSICHWYHTSHNSSSDRKFGSLELFPRPLPSFLLLVDVFHGGVVSLPESKSRGLFSAAMCKIQASKCYVEFLPLVLNNKKVASYKVKASFYSCLLIVCLPSESRTLNWDLETTYTYIAIGLVSQVSIGPLSSSPCGLLGVAN